METHLALLSIAFLIAAAGTCNAQEAGLADKAYPDQLLSHISNRAFLPDWNAGDGEDQPSSIDTGSAGIKPCASISGKVDEVAYPCQPLAVGRTSDRLGIFNVSPSIVSEEKTVRAFDTSQGRGVR